MFYLQMDQKTVATLTLGGLVCVAATMAVAISQMAGLDRSIAAMSQSQNRTIHMQEYKETVETSSGRTIEVRTVRGENESPADFAKRHDEAVQAAKAL